MSNYYYWLDCISRSNTERKFLDNNYYRKINNYYNYYIELLYPRIVHRE